MENTPDRDSMELSNRQLAFIRELENIDSKLKKMYLGALTVINDGRNPDKYAQAAHSLRELMENISKAVTVEAKALDEKLKSEVRKLEDCYDNRIEKTENYTDGEWNGEIDKHLKKILGGLVKFMEWLKKNMLRRGAAISKTISGLDHYKQSLPANLAKDTNKKWSKLNGYFQAVAHHNTETNDGEFNFYLKEFENLLLGLRLPETYEEHQDIDAIIREVEGND